MTEEELPIERGFPIEKVNDIAEKEGRAKMYYRPIYTMHKWWARRLGCVFRTICLYTLVDDPEKVEVHELNGEGSLADFSEEDNNIGDLIDNVDIDTPESLWELYTKDVRVKDKKVLDPFMGGGTSLVEVSRFGVESVGYDLNPVAWFVTKKQLEAGDTDVKELEKAFEKVKEDVAEEIKQYYRTSCPNGDHKTDVMYYFWVKELDCVSCGETVPLFKDYRVAKGRYENDDKYNVLCPNCESVVLVDDWRSESVCNECAHSFVPENGNVSRGKYSCPDCGQQYSITDAIQEQDGFDMRLYALEYYCSICDDDRSKGKSDVKGYKRVDDVDRELYMEAKEEWGKREDLHDYVPDWEIRSGWKTASKKFEGNAPGAGNLKPHGYKKWTDMYNERQLLSISKLMKSLDSLENQNVKEFLLLALSDALRTNSAMVSYDPTRNGMDHIFRTNSFDPPMYPAENNVWGTDFGRGSFTSSWNMVMEGVEYAKNPTERYIDNSGETVETESFPSTIGGESKVYQGDMREINSENEFDVVITDPPYYDNVMYSELSDYFYVWLKPVLEKEYECFEKLHTPRTESIVSNPAEGKDVEEFESELRQAFSKINQALKNDGVLTFTYHHSDSESWGELLTALCDVGFEVTATYPITADINKFTEGEAVEFDIIVVARPTDNCGKISWNDLRIQIYDTAHETRKRLEQNRELSRGDIGVIEMGECFQEYSKYHGNVYREGEVMDAKEVVDEIYGIIQEASDIGATEVFIDLLNTDDPDFDDVNKLCRGANTTPDELKEMRLFNTENGFELGTWSNEQRVAYLQDQLREGDLTTLDKLQLLRYRYDREKRIGRFVDDWLDSELRRLAAKMKDVTGDGTYEEMLEIRPSDEGEARDEGGQSKLEDYTEEDK